RDATDTGFDYKGKRFLLIDTAGIRHNMKLKESVDFFGSVRSKEAIKRCDVAVVLIDGFDGLREDDSRIINSVIDEGRALVVAVNKWDLVKEAETARYKEMLISKLNLIKNYPVIFMSSKTGKNVPPVLDAAWTAYEKSKIIFKPDELISILETLNNSPEIRNRSIKFLYLAQKAALPPTFVLGVKKSGIMNENLRRYAENFLRRARDFEGVPIRVSFEGKSKH
ncbi:MAG: GTP-binding protein, partial [Candidatus Omnitrophota bacterium]|nr:GTP-binding protein [Candidatus Omnitrophota bacterium]